MTEPSDRVFCRRLHLARTPEEHTACPYCFGKEKQVVEGAREKFCDYDPDKDPVVFGFPDESSRLRDG